jgi:hypothetical protein
MASELQGRTAMDPRGGRNSAAAYPDAPSSREPLGIIGEQTIHILSDANNHAERLLVKLRGSQPSNGAEAGKEPERSLILDAIAARNLASRLVDRLTEANDLLGG